MSKPDVATERKLQIVKATVECIIQKGYHNFSMQDVAKTAGVSKGIIHYYFLNKDELMMCVLDKVAGDIEDILSQEMTATFDPVRKLEIFVAVLANVVRNTKAYYQVNMDFWTQINQKENVREVISRHYQNYRETGSTMIDEGIAKGIFKPVDSKKYASYIIGVVDGLSLQWLFDDKSIDYDATISMVTKQIMDGLKP